MQLAMSQMIIAVGRPDTSDGYKRTCCHESGKQRQGHSVLSALADALGWEVRADVPGNYRIGTDDDARLSLFDGRPPSQNVHFGFLVDEVDDVHRIYEQLLASGWADDGAPGPRPEYSEGYYGGFVAGPDGNSYEAFTRV